MLASTAKAPPLPLSEHSAGPALAPFFSLVETRGGIVAEGAPLSMSALPPKAAARATHWRVR